MRLFHGSKEIIEKPLFGYGSPFNDYGKGFYCTKEIEMAKEWSCTSDHDGYANSYEIDFSDLKILNLNDTEYTILHWLTILLKNRSFRLSNPIARDAKDYLLANFSIRTEGYDVITGYRADDSYFSFASDFLNNTISVNKLAKAMKLGELGEQVVLVSQKAFDRLTFTGAEKAEREKYFVLRSRRDKRAREAYLFGDRKRSYTSDELYIIDIMRKEIKSHDPRLQ
ncbi:MAG: DUF3990 domain-containing protein [Sphaerochaetaceae bacterium]|nr:DUF3990 domain-containing protein [Sphaerochaetaceae bacterium]